MEICVERFTKLVHSISRNFLQVGREDPRRVVYALKVGVALTLVSLLYVSEPLFNGIGKNAIWAVLTVVVVIEFTAGATLCKGLNRALGTFLAGTLAFFIEFIANRATHVIHAVFIASAVFVVGAATTYIRFVPYIKRNYDYGMVVFLLTFNLIAVSSYRVDDILDMAEQRFYTIAIGCGICLLMSICMFPNWSGEELHHRTVAKLEGLASSLEGCVNQYFNDSTSENPEDELSDDPVYVAVLDSTSIDETLALYASWEPRYSRQCFKFPWKQYVKVGGSLRHFGYTVVALHGCLHTEIQTPKDVRHFFKDPCISLATEISKALRELGSSIRNRRQCSSADLLDHIHQALRDLETVLKSQPRLFLHPTTTTNNTLPQNVAGIDTSTLLELKSKEAPSGRRMLRTLSKIAITSLEFAEALPFAAFASLLLETVARLDLVIEEVEELGRVAHYKEFRPGDEVVVNCDEGRTPVHTALQNHLPSNDYVA